MNGPGASTNGAFKYRQPVVVVLLSLITCGIYHLYWVYQLGREMREHNGSGIGPGLNLVFGIFMGIVLCFTLPNDVKATYERDGRFTDISALTGFWNFLPIAGWIVWVVKVQGRLNTLWVETEGVSPGGGSGPGPFVPDRGPLR
jgi:hypothetical protein